MVSIVRPLNCPKPKLQTTQAPQNRQSPDHAPLSIYSRVRTTRFNSVYFPYGFFSSSHSYKPCAVCFVSTTARNFNRISFYLIIFDQHFNLYFVYQIKKKILKHRKPDLRSHFTIVQR